MRNEPKSILNSTVLGGGEPTRKDDSDLAWKVCAVAGAGLGALAGACTGSSYKVAKAFSGAAAGAALGALFSWLGAEMKA